VSGSDLSHIYGAGIAGKTFIIDGGGKRHETVVFSEVYLELTDTRVIKVKDVHYTAGVKDNILSVGALADTDIFFRLDPDNPYMVFDRDKKAELLFHQRRFLVIANPRPTPSPITTQAPGTLAPGEAGVTYVAHEPLTTPAEKEDDKSDEETLSAALLEIAATLKLASRCGRGDDDDGDTSRHDHNGHPDELTVHRERASNDANGDALRHERNDDANDDDAGAGVRDTTPGAGELHVDGNIARFDGSGINCVDLTNFGGTEVETVRSGEIFSQRYPFHGDSDDSDNVMTAPDTRFFYDRTDSDTDASMPELVSASESDDSTCDNQDHADDENDMANSEIYTFQGMSQENGIMEEVD
jgi:hypothetical protein